MNIAPNKIRPNTIVCNIYPQVVGLLLEFNVFNPILLVTLYINGDEIIKKISAAIKLAKNFCSKFKSVCVIFYIIKENYFLFKNTK